MLKYIVFFVFIIFTKNINSKQYSLPGDTGWPTKQDINAFRSSISGETFTINDPGYINVYKQTFNYRTGPPLPTIIIIPSNVDDIMKVVAFAKAHNIRLSVRSTGHHQDVRNMVDNSLLVDMRMFDHKSIDVNQKTITVGPGQTFAEIQEFIYNTTGGTLVAVSGAEPSVGPAGWVLGGGHGRLTRLHGLGVDVLLSVNIVLANGTEVTVDSNQHSDLFRALKGSGGSAYGIITSLTFRIFDDPGPVSEFVGFFSPTSEVADLYQSWLKTAPNNAGAYYLITGIPNNTYTTISAFCFGERDSCFNTLNPLSKIPDCYATSPSICIVNQTYSSYQNYLMANKNNLDFGENIGIYLVSAALDLSNSGDMRIPTNWVASYNTSDWPQSLIGCYANSILGGVSANLDPDQKLTTVAPAMRKSLVALTCYVGWLDYTTSRPDMVAKIDLWADTELRKLSVDSWVYWNEPQHNFVGLDWQDRYWGKNAYAQLKQVKNVYDPDNIFTCYHCVGWEEVKNMDPAVCPSNCSCSNIVVPGTCANKVPLALVGNV